MTAQEIQNHILNQDNYDCTDWGLRAHPDEDDTNIYKVDDYLPNSYVWSDGEMTDTELNGTCTIGIYDTTDIQDIQGALDLLDNYYGTTIFIVTGEHGEHGVDTGEIIMQNAKINKIFTSNN